MDIQVIQASMTHTKEDGYLGQVVFEVTNHKHPYEITLQSKYGKEWSYGLFFYKESGSEEEILQVEEMIEEQDQYFDLLVEKAKEAITL